MRPSSRSIVCYQAAGGLGDQTTDLLGGLVMAQAKRCMLEWHWKARPQNYPGHGDLLYDPRLFDFSEMRDILKIYLETDPIAASRPYFQLHFQNPSSSSCPFKVHAFLNRPVNNLHSTIDNYKYFARKIKPAAALLQKYLLPISPADVVLGIHLRCSDKIVEHATDSCYVNASEFFAIQNEIIMDINKRNLGGVSPTLVYVCSENEEAKEALKSKLESIFSAKISFVEPLNDIPAEIEHEYKGARAVRDMFCLSMCKVIYQSVNYSTFSLLASMIGSAELVNYSLGKSQTIQYGWVAERYCLTEESLSCWAAPRMEHHIF